MAQLREMVYGDQGTTMNFLNYVMNQKYWKWSKNSGWDGWDTVWNAGAEPLQDVNAT
jgi:hypothetical protein